MKTKKVSQRKTAKKASDEKNRLKSKNRNLKARLDEVEETLRAITSGEVDAFVVETGSGQQVFTLRSNEHPYRMMVESMNEGAATLLHDGTFIYCNNQLAELLEKEVSDIPGKDLSMFVASNDRRAFDVAFAQSKVKPSKIEMFLALESGSLIATQISMAPVELDGTSAISIIVTDLREQKQNEALIVSEKLTRSILEQAAEAIIVCNERGEIIRANPAAHQLAGSNLFSQSFDDAFQLVKDSGETFSCAELKSESHRTKGLAVSFIRHDQALFFLSMSVSHLRNSDVGLGYVFTLTDITPLKTTEAALRFQSHVTETIANNAASCLIMLDKNDRPTFMNPAAERVTGYKLVEIKEKNIYSVLARKKSLQNTKSPNVETEIGGCDVEREESFIRKNGRSFPVSFSISPLTSDGKGIGSVLEFRDITEQKRIETELLVAKEAAESASNLKTAFLANMSHEIRTPLGAILGFTELLKDSGVSPSDRREYLDIISRSGKSLTRLIDDILDLSKVEAGRLDVEKISFSLPILLNEVVAMFSEKAKNKGIALFISSDEEMPEIVKTDPTRLRQILVNVIGNAVKFTQQGSVKIEISTEVPVNGNQQLIIRVIDTGSGLTVSQSERLFEPFSQGDNSTTRKFGGTGLGLILSRRLARALGGDVTLESTEKGAGTTFQITVAIEGEIQSEFSRRLKVSQKISRKKNLERIEDRLSGLRVLVVEDSPDNQILIRRILSKNGAQVEIASNGREGVERALDAEFDVLLMDIQMPVLDGYKATTELRQSGYSRPIIALTAYAMEEERQRCLEIGCNAHLSKPINSTLLVETIVSLMSPGSRSRTFHM